MTIFGGFQEPAFRDKISGPVLRFSTFFLVGLAGFLLFIISFTMILPSDIFTSALFFDNLELQPVFGDPAAVFQDGGLWERFPDVSTEGFSFAMGLVLFQLVAGYMAGVSGNWTQRSNNIFNLVFNLIKRQERISRISDFNWRKAGWSMAYWFVAIFDTFTDAVYRSWFGDKGTGLVLISLLVSFIYYSMFSEWALIMGSRVALNYGLQSFREAIEWFRSNREVHSVNLGRSPGRSMPSSGQIRTGAIPTSFQSGTPSGRQKKRK